MPNNYEEGEKAVDEGGAGEWGNLAEEVRFTGELDRVAEKLPKQSFLGNIRAVVHERGVNR